MMTIIRDKAKTTTKSRSTKQNKLRGFRMNDRTYRKVQVFCKHYGFTKGNGNAPSVGALLEHLVENGFAMPKANIKK